MTALDVVVISPSTKHVVSTAEPVPMPRLAMPVSYIPSNEAPLNTPPLSPSPWRDVAARKCEDRASRLRVYSEWSLGADLPSSSQKNVVSLVHTRLTQRERSFLALDVTSLAGRLATGDCTSVEVTTAFCKAAYAAQELTNCLTEIMFTQALVRAQELDDHLAETGQVVGPLHGVPVSIKDHILVKGEDTATGYIAWAGRTISDRDACVVQILRAAGAVIYVKTANPQSLLCEYFIFQKLHTAFNFDHQVWRHRITFMAIPLIHSIAIYPPVGAAVERAPSSIPAAWSGLYGFKPSVARMPHTGLLGSHDGMDNIVGVVGPLAHSARDLELFCRVMAQYESWTLEHQVLNIPWNQTVAQSRGEGLPKRLVIGILNDDGVVAPHPPITAELQKTRAALLAAGHEVIDWMPMEHQEVKLYLLDGGKEYRETLAESGEPAMPLVEWMLSHAAGRPSYPVDQTWALNVAREQFRARGLRHWNASAARSEQGRAFDAVLCPVAPTLAPPHDTTRWWGYSSYWNLLDLPAVVFPSGKPLDAATWDRSREAALPAARNMVEEFVRNQWDPSTYNGAPVSLQLVGRRLHEEKVLAILNVVEDAVARFENAGSKALES
ncbi:glutamyl-tRNA(gln) amidotransferase subunit A [Rhizoctonia solani AG-1 IA]|uniref:Glutamyl-tRNA(Gln) amidotransferase subunit A n=1 Tax=Thanatephorus cucumeris (strain AG1-IA) TaxID=983506 RepID=L8WQ85_THACA|nr:glutamyl-tRNA(gln) amidotransferase subunit A [Rhizoctonia solani AG-1 IA]